MRPLIFRQIRAVLRFFSASTAWRFAVPGSWGLVLGSTAGIWLANRTDFHRVLPEAGFARPGRSANFDCANYFPGAVALQWV